MHNVRQSLSHPVGGTARTAVLRLFPLLVFFLVLDIEMSIGGMGGGAERVGYSSTLVGDALEQNTEQGLAIKVSDILMLAIFFLLIASSTIVHRLWGFRRRDLSCYLLLLGFVGIASSALIWNRSLYTGAQLEICAVYLAKFSEVSLVYVFTLLFLNLGGSVRLLVKATTVGGLLAGGIGIVDSFSGFFTGWMIMDRVQFYGTLVLLESVWLAIILADRGYLQKTLRINRMFLWWLIVIVGISILLCGKRTVTLGFAASISYVMLLNLRKGNWIRMMPAIVLVVVGGSTSLGEQVMSSFGRDSQYLSEGLSYNYASRISESWIGELDLPGLDYSVSERLAKWLVATDHFFERPLIGSGYWGAPYAFDFLPDSAYFQVLVEVGLIGAVLLFVFFARHWAKAGHIKKERPQSGYPIGYKGAFLGICVMGVTANTLYISTLFSTFLMLSAVIYHNSRDIQKSGRAVTLLRWRGDRKRLGY